MGLELLVGRRTGRPPGSSSVSPWKRDVLWAYRHLGDPDAMPPSPMAERLLALGREEPDRLIACLVMVTGEDQQPERPRPGADGTKTAGQPAATPFGEGV